MEPIAALPPAAASSLLGLCFDVDDTVTTHGLLDPEAYRSLFALRAVGLRLIAVTGRPLGFAEILARTWPIDAAVGENGAGFIAKLDGRLRTGYWDPVELRTSQQQKLAKILERAARELPQIEVASDAWARRCDLAFDIGEHASVARPEIDRLVALIESEGAHASVSSVHAHAQLGTHDKARGVVRALHELWGLDEQSLKSRFLFVGDSGNDAAAFAWFSLTAAVANVARHLDRLPTPPRYVASAEYGAGFAEIARAVLKKRGAAP